MKGRLISKVLASTSTSFFSLDLRLHLSFLGTRLSSQVRVDKARED